MLKNFLKEFRDFAERGSAIDMAVGVIAGAAMNGVVNSLVKDVIMPPIGMLLGDMDMSEIAIRLTHNTKIGIGLFMNSLLSFVITMFAVFMFVRIMNRMGIKKAAATRDCPYCCTKISIKATKCPNCCSAVRPVKPAPEEETLLEKLSKGEFLEKKKKK